MPKVGDIVARNRERKSGDTVCLGVEEGCVRKRSATLNKEGGDVADLAWPTNGLV